MHVRPRLFLCLATVLTVLTASPRLPRAYPLPDIYGEDDRYELYEVSDPKIKTWARAVAAVVPRKLMNRDGTFRTGRTTLGRTRRNVSAGRPKRLPVVPNERFSDQPLYGIGTAFLVGPDLLVTAGHCVKDAEDLKNYYFVFGYELDPATQSIKRSVGRDNVFEGREIIFSTRTVKADRKRHDYALIRLSRKATVSSSGRANGRQPLRFRREGQLDSKARLVMIGYPMGLPLKVTDSGHVRKNTAGTSFTTTLDAFGGNSGSPVLNHDTGVVEGILVRGTRVVWREVVIDGQGFAETIKFDEETGGVGTDVERITNVKALKEGLSEGVQIFDAMRAGNMNRVIALIEAGARLKGVKDLKGRNHLHVAMDLKNAAMARLFLERGISHKARDAEGNTPLHYASRHGFLRGVQALIAKSAPVNATNNEGETPYHLASTRGHPKVAAYLVARGANKSIRPKDYQRLSEELIRAARGNDVRRVLELISMPRVDVNLGDDTALIWATYNGHTNVVKALLRRRDLDVNTENSRGANALLWADAKGHGTIRSLLRSRGAREGGLQRQLRRAQRSKRRGRNRRPNYSAYRPQLRYGFIVDEKEKRLLDGKLLARIRAGDVSAVFSAGWTNQKKKNWRAAHKWYDRAVARGNRAAMNNLAVMYEGGRGVEADRSKAFQLYRRAARLGNPMAMKNLGNCYEFGRGVRQSKADALIWYRKAKKAGRKDVDKRLARVQPPTGIRTATDSSFDALVAKNGYCSVVYFRGANGLCKVFDRVFSSVCERGPGACYFRVDRSDATERTFRRFGIDGTPTVLFLRNGRVVARKKGILSKRNLTKLIMELMEPR